MLSVPSTIWTKVWNLAIYETTYSLERLSPMKSVSWYYLFPKDILQILFEIDGTVLKDFPPDMFINNCVFPDPLSPTIPISLLAPFDFFLKIKRKANIKMMPITE